MQTLTNSMQWLNQFPVILNMRSLPAQE